MRRRRQETWSASSTLGRWYSPDDHDDGGGDHDHDAGDGDDDSGGGHGDDGGDDTFVVAPHMFLGMQVPPTGTLLPPPTKAAS